MPKPRMLVISKVYPFPRNSGQQQRVYYKLRAFREHFHITFLAVASSSRVNSIRKKILEVCDDAIILPSRYSGNLLNKLYHRFIGWIFSLRTGLKFSNYLISRVELTADRIAEVINSEQFDIVVYEYWHTFESVPHLKASGAKCVLDMHNLLWQSYDRQLKAKAYIPKIWKKWAVEQYKTQEEQAWCSYDGLIAINAGECEYARQHVPEQISIFYAPMGTDLTSWPYSWNPAFPHRLAYYGGLGSPHNQQDALTCYEKIMPLVWEKYPQTEFWIVGSNPPDFIIKLSQKDLRINVTGYVENVQDVLKLMSIVLCPWSGTYGFRSRIIEVMALGVPVVASLDAVHGMNIKNEQGIFTVKTFREMAKISINLLQDSEELNHQSLLARQQIEEQFSYEATYGELAQNLLTFATYGM